MQIGKREVVDAVETKLVAGLLMASKLDPFEGNVAPLEKVADGVSLRRPASPIKTDSWSKFHNRSFDLRVAPTLFQTPQRQN